MSDAPETGPLGRVRAVASAHPVIFWLFVFCIVVGAVAGGVLLPGEWSLARRIAAGVVSGAGVALLVSAPRIVG